MTHRFRLQLCTSLTILLITFAPLIHAQAGMFDVTTNMGSGTERLQWNIAGPGGSPNVLSELSFGRSTTVFGDLGLRWSEPTWSIGVLTTYGSLLNGNVQDDDFTSDNRQGLFSRSIDKVGGSYILSIDGTATYAFFRRDWVKLEVVGGGRYYRQRWQIENGNQVVCNTPCSGPLGPFEKLNSSYSSTWYGPELGLQGKIKIWTLPVWAKASSSWYPYMTYAGQGVWNLRTDLMHNPSFKHTAHGAGASFDVGLVWVISKRYELAGGWRWLEFNASNGTDTSFFSDGSSSSAPLNHVTTRSTAFYFGLTTKW